MLREQKEANHSSAAVEVDPLDVVVVGVAPVHGAAAVVQRQPVGPQHVGGDEDAAVGSVHPGLLDAADAVVDLVLLPVRPVHPAAGKYTARLQKGNSASNKMVCFFFCLPRSDYKPKSDCKPVQIEKPELYCALQVHKSR